MLKLFAFLLLMPLATFAEDSCSQASCENVIHVRENHPKLHGLEVELEDGQVISLTEFLKNISNQDPSGEVPWPIVDPEDEENKKNEDED